MAAKVSVIMPVYNQERYVGAAVSCVLAQTFRDFEFVIVDDGSTDRTIEIIESFSDERIRLMKADHQGYIPSLARATAEAQGEWLARMDSDDLCPPDRLQKQVDFVLSHDDCVFVTSAYGIITPNERFLAPDWSNNWSYVEPSDITFGKKLFCDAAAMYRREAAVSLGYDHSLPVETPLWFRLLNFGKAAVFEEPLYFVRWRLGSLSRSSDAEYTAINVNVRKKYDPENADAASRGKGRRHRFKNEILSVNFSTAAGDLAGARSVAFSVWKRFPLSLVSYKLLVMSLGLMRPNSVEGPCRAVFSSTANPIENTTPAVILA